MLYKNDGVLQCIMMLQLLRNLASDLESADSRAAVFDQRVGEMFDGIVGDATPEIQLANSLHDGGAALNILRAVYKKAGKHSGEFAQAMVVYVSSMLKGDFSPPLYSVVLQEQGVKQLSGFLAVMTFLGMRLTREGVIALAKASSTTVVQPAGVVG